MKGHATSTYRTLVKGPMFGTWASDCRCGWVCYTRSESRRDALRERDRHLRTERRIARELQRLGEAEG